MAEPKWKQPIQALFVPVVGEIRLVEVAEHWERETWRRLLDVPVVERDLVRPGVRFYGDDAGRIYGKPANPRASRIAGSTRDDYYVGDIYFVGSDPRGRHRSVTDWFVRLAGRRTAERAPAPF